MGRERREDPRVYLSLQAWWEGLSGRHEARVADLSVGGCYIDSVGKAAPGELIVFALRLPDGRWLELRGRVVTAEPNIGFSLSVPLLTEEEQEARKEKIDGRN